MFPVLLCNATEAITAEHSGNLGFVLRDPCETDRICRTSSCAPVCTIPPLVLPLDHVAGKDAGKEI